MWDDVLEGNRRYREGGHISGLDGVARKGVAIVTCIDSRLDPRSGLGLESGDAKIIRNAGGRVTPDVLRSLVLATNLLGAKRVCLIHHTKCAVIGSSNDDLHARLHDECGIDADAWDFLATTDPVAAMHDDLEAIRGCPELAADIEVAGFVFDVDTGELIPFDER